MTDKNRTFDPSSLEDDEYFEGGYPYNKELDFNQDPVTEYLPEPEDDYFDYNPVEDE